MKTEYLVIGLIILIAIGVGIYFMVTPADGESVSGEGADLFSGEGTDFNTDAGVGVPPALPE